MAKLLVLPAIMATKSKCIVTKWNFKEGDAVKAGDDLFDVEIGKTSVSCKS